MNRIYSMCGRTLQKSPMMGLARKGEPTEKTGLVYIEKTWRLVGWASLPVSA